ncbi:DNA helicase [Bosea minatitlanensis]|uniref:DNA helicase n=1 Tax=Bosea minatitlanensis TaxID=128782 RepID=A0ABW0F4W3_9HYPH|nr:DNA helicase [Bosea minatitlanensis]MCT4492902.1 DNA helicase [Bosea minatitlanensis]
MKLPVPIHHLKRRAKLLHRREQIPLHAALDRIATAEGYRRWSLLAARQPVASVATALYRRLDPGDLVLVAGRPGQGKTLVSLALAAEAARAGRRSAFFSLEYTPGDVVERLRALGFETGELAGFFDLDCSDAISADYVGAALAAAPAGTLAVIDYLQLLDQRRDRPELSRQVGDLKALARQRGLIIVLLSQVDRSYDPAAKPFPDITDIHLPNPVDLRLFDKRCFLNGGEIRFEAAA